MNRIYIPLKESTNIYNKCGIQYMCGKWIYCTGGSHTLSWEMGYKERALLKIVKLKNGSNVKSSMRNSYAHFLIYYFFHAWFCTIQNIPICAKKFRLFSTVWLYECGDNTIRSHLPNNGCGKKIAINSLFCLIGTHAWIQSLRYDLWL